MEKHNDVETNYSLYYILALIFGILTGWVVTSSVFWSITGAILGLLTAGFFVNVLVKGREEKS